MLEFQNTKIFLLKNTFQIGQKNFLLLIKLNSDLNGEEVTGSFYEKELQNTSQEKFRIEKVIKRKVDKLYVKRKGYDNSFNSWIDKNDIV